MGRTPVTSRSRRWRACSPSISPASISAAPGPLNSALGDCERARPRRPRAHGRGRPGDNRPALAAHPPIVAQPAAARRRAVDPMRAGAVASCHNSCCGSRASISGIRPDWRSWRCCSVPRPCVASRPANGAPACGSRSLVAASPSFVLNAARRCGHRPVVSRGPRHPAARSRRLAGRSTRHSAASAPERARSD